GTTEHDPADAVEDRHQWPARRAVTPMVISGRPVNARSAREDRNRRPRISSAPQHRQQLVDRDPVDPVDPVDGTADELHWNDRRGVARAVRLVVLVVPILNSMACGLVAAHLLPTPTSRLWLLPWWTGVLLAAVAGLVVSDRVARKLLPL